MMSRSQAIKEASPSPFGSMRVPGLKSWTVQDSADVEEALERVRTKRHVASTALNEAGRPCDLTLRPCFCSDNIMGSGVK
jgi:hypothetical protein